MALQLGLYLFTQNISKGVRYKEDSDSSDDESVICQSSYVFESCM